MKYRITGHFSKKQGVKVEFDDVVEAGNLEQAFRIYEKFDHLGTVTIHYIESLDLRDLEEDDEGLTQ